MMISEEAIVGKKGEILPKKKLREIAGLSPGDKVTITASPYEIVIKKVLSIDDLFNLPPICSVTPSQFKAEVREEMKDIAKNL